LPLPIANIGVNNMAVPSTRIILSGGYRTAEVSQ